MAAHEADLRVEVATELTRASSGNPADPAADALIQRQAASFAADIAAQGSEAAEEPRLRILLRYAERLALTPASCSEDHIQELRDQGFSDEAIHDAAQVIAYFAYINRIADGLGVDLEPEMLD